MCFDHINFPLLHLLSDPSSHFLSFFFSLKETKNVESSFCFHIIPGVGLSTGAWLPCQRWASVMALNKTVSASTVSHLLPTAYSQPLPLHARTQAGSCRDLTHSVRAPVCLWLSLPYCVQKTLFPGSYPQCLALTLFLPCRPQWSLRPGVLVWFRYHS